MDKVASFSWLKSALPDRKVLLTNGARLPAVTLGELVQSRELVCFSWQDEVMEVMTQNWFCSSGFLTYARTVENSNGALNIEEVLSRYIEFVRRPTGWLKSVSWSTVFMTEQAIAAFRASDKTSSFSNLWSILFQMHREHERSLTSKEARNSLNFGFKFFLQSLVNFL